MGKLSPCPECKRIGQHRYGSPKLGGFCKDHPFGATYRGYSHGEEDENDKHFFADYPSTHEGEFFSEDFGMIKDTFGYEE